MTIVCLECLDVLQVLFDDLTNVEGPRYIKEYNYVANVLIQLYKGPLEAHKKDQKAWEKLP